MDILRDYADFSSDIQIGFNRLINEFNLELLKPVDGIYLLKNENCIIKFTYDRGDVFCNFLRPFDSPYDQGYNVALVYRFFNDKESETKFTPKRIFDRQVQISNFGILIYNHLQSVIKGDFSWVSDFSKEDDYDSKAFLYMLDHFDKQHPISKKFWNGDQTWRNDLDQYLKEKGIDFR